MQERRLAARARSNRSFDADARRRAFASLRPCPPGAGQLRR
jgi:hypothetical protein